MFKLLFAVLLSLVSLSVAQAQQGEVRVVDEEGVAVDQFEGMWHTADNGYSLWTRQQNGVWKDFFGSRENVTDVIIRAKGFASRVQRFEGPSLRELRDGKTTIVLKRGKEVTIEAQHLASPIPKDFVMESFFPEFAWRVHMMWQPINFTGQKKPDWNMLNVQQVDDSHFTVRVAEYTGEFCLAFQHPGWLQFCEFGPFQAHEAASKRLQLPMPAPAKIQVTFDPRAPEKERGYQSANCTVYWKPDDSGTVYIVNDPRVPLEANTPVTFADLGPGRYLVDVRTTPKGDAPSSSTTDIHPGKFFERETVTLRSGQSADVAFAWVPFDPQAFRGTAHSKIKVTNGDGTIPAGREIKVSWFDGHYGSLVAFQGPLPDTGIIHLSYVSAVKHRSAAGFGPYRISIAGEQLGFFTLKDTQDVQPLQFTVSPKAGDIAPDIELIEATSEQRRKLSDYRGQVVLLEFWSTSCGPCQPAMQKLTELAADMPAPWVDKVVLLSLSTDHEFEKLRRHIASRGWNKMSHFRGTRGDDEYFSDAEKAYVVHGIPHAILIDQQGKVRWRGHPSLSSEGQTVNDRINALLK